jgi:hypothetical protein
VRSLRVIVVFLASALVVAPAAFGKEGVRATLTTPIPLNASSGTTLHVGWTLANRDGTPFGGGNVFVRLRSATGDGAETAYTNGPGTFAADVVVPKGGIGDVQIGIRGWSSGPDGTHEAPMFFPITNDPMPGPAQISAPPPNSTRWPVLLGAFAVLIAAAVFAVLLNRRRVRFSAGTARPGPSRTQTGT